MDWTRFASLVDDWPDRYDGIDCTALDPADDEDREIGLAAAHPEYHQALADDEDVESDEGGQISPRLHILVHRGVAEQLITGAPRVRETAERLLAEGHGAHEVLHMLGDVLSKHLYRTMVAGDTPSGHEYVADLEALPDPPLHDDDEHDASFLDDEFATPFLPYRERIEQVLLGSDEPLFAETLADEIDLADPLTPEDLALYLRWHEDFAHVLPDGRVAHERQVLDGLVLLHELTPAERDVERIDLAHLGVFLTIDGHREGIPLATGGKAEVRLRHAVDGPEVGRHAHGPAVFTLEGPPGWLAAAGDGPVVALAWRDGLLHVEAAAADEVAATRAGRALAEAFAARADTDPDHSRWNLGALEIDELLLDVLAAHGDVLRRPTAPVPVLLARAGLSLHGDWVAAGDYDWDEHRRRHRQSELDIAIEDAWVHPDDEHDIRRLIDEVESWLNGEATGDRELSRAGDALLVPGAAVAVFNAHGRYGGEDSQRRLLALAQQVAGARGVRNGAGAHAVAALCADGLEEGVTADRHLREAMAGGVSPPQLHEMATDYLFVAGDLARAARSLELVEELDDTRLELVEVLAPFAVGAGRNDPCPCGSGRKFKQCHGQAGGPPLDAAGRAELAYLRAAVLSDRGRQRRLAAIGAMQGLGYDIDRGTGATQQRRRLARDIVMFEAGGLDEVVTGWGPLLPEADRRLLEAWAGTPISVTEDSVTRLLPIEGGTWQPWELPLGDTDAEELQLALEDADHRATAEALAPLLSG